MFNGLSNGMCNRAAFISHTICGMESDAGMHETMRRLYLAAETLRGWRGQTFVAAKLDLSPQALNNWESRGMSKGGMLAAQSVIGCSANWLATGIGEMCLSEQVAPSISASDAKLLDNWAKLRDSQQRTLLAQIDAMISDNLTALEELTRIGLKGDAKPKKQPGELIDPTLPDPNEFTTFANKRADGERRTRQIEVDHDRRGEDRRNK